MYLSSLLYNERLRSNSVGRVGRLHYIGREQQVEPVPPGINALIEAAFKLKDNNNGG